MTGSVDFVDEYAHGWKLGVTSGELVAERFLGTASSRDTFKYVSGSPISLIEQINSYTFRVSDPSSILSSANTSLVDIQDRYGSIVHAKSLVSMVAGGYASITTQLPCVCSTDRFSSDNVGCRLRGQGALFGNDGWVDLQPDCTVSWRFGPLRKNQSYVFDITLDISTTNSSSGLRAAIDESGESVFADNLLASASALSWTTSQTTKTATVTLASSLEVRDRVVFAIANTGSERALVRFYATGSGELVHISAGPIARATDDGESAFTCLASNGALLSIKARGSELAPLPGYREGTANISLAFDERLYAYVPCSVASVGDKLRVLRGTVATSTNTNTSSSSMIQFKPSIVPVDGTPTTQNGRAAIVRVPGSVAIPAIVPVSASKINRVADRVQIRAGDGILRALVTSTSNTAVFSISARVARVGSHLSAANANLSLLGTLTSSPGTFVFPQRIVDMANIAGVVFDIARVDSQFAANVEILPSIDGFDLLSCSKQKFDVPVSVENDMEAQQAVNVSSLEIGQSIVFSPAANTIQGNSLCVDDSSALHFTADKTVHVGNCAIDSANAEFNVHSNLSVRTLKLLNNTATVTGNATTLTFPNAAVFGQTSCDLGPLSFATASSNPALVAPGLLSFDGTTVRVLNPASTQVFVGSFTGTHLCRVAPGWKGSLAMRPDSVGMVVSSSGRFPTGILQTQALPSVQISNARQDKSVFGIIARALHIGEASPQIGGGLLDVSLSNAAATTFPRIIVCSLGEGGVWVLDTNGPVENGDYLQTSATAGFAEKQESDEQQVYTLGKSTCNADFTGAQHPRTPYNSRSAFIGLTIHCA